MKNNFYITGDTHGYIDFKKLEIFAKENPQLSKKDYVLILGDFGAVWDEKTLEHDLKRYSELPFTILFIDGNHENFDLLESFDIKIWHGGKVRFIKDDIVYLMRGQVFSFGKKSFFTFGGATSKDRARRTEKINWWQRETPNDADFEEAAKNLEKADYKVDYVFTHTCDETTEMFLPFFSFSYRKILKEHKYLSFFEQNVKYSKWYFGHYHTDLALPDCKTAVYKKIIKLF